MSLCGENEWKIHISRTNRSISHLCFWCDIESERELQKNMSFLPIWRKVCLAASYRRRYLKKIFNFSRIFSLFLSYVPLWWQKMIRHSSKMTRGIFLIFFSLLHTIQYIHCHMSFLVKLNIITNEILSANKKLLIKSIEYFSTSSLYDSLTVFFLFSILTSLKIDHWEIKVTFICAEEEEMRGTCRYAR